MSKLKVDGELGVRQSVYEMTTVERALSIVLENADALPATRVSLERAHGAVLAEDVRASEPLPPFPAAILDGYAVVAADGPGDYPVVARVTAGHAPDFTLRPGQVAAITTGAPMPQGSDAVIKIEDTEDAGAAEGAGAGGSSSEIGGDVGTEGRVRMLKGVKAGASIRPIGKDIVADQLVLPKGTHLGAAEIALLATVGAGGDAQWETAAPAAATTAAASSGNGVLVYRRPRVGILSTGNELQLQSTSPP